MATELSAFDMPLCQMSSPTEKQDDVTASDIHFTWLDEHCPSPRYQVVGHRSHCILTDISNECLLVQKGFFFFSFSAIVTTLCSNTTSSTTSSGAAKNDPPQEESVPFVTSSARGISRTVRFSTNLEGGAIKGHSLF